MALVKKGHTVIVKNVINKERSQPAFTCSNLTIETLEQGVTPLASLWCLYC